MAAANYDLLVSNTGSHTVSLLLGNGNGTFQAKTDFAQAGTTTEGVAAADIDGDGKVDFVVPNTGASAGLRVLSVYLGNGNGTFKAPVTYSVGNANNWVALGKLRPSTTNNFDAVIGSGSTTVQVLLGNGNGTFAAGIPYTVAAGVATSVLAIGDVNGDSNPDLAVATTGSAKAYCLLGNGNGTFQAGQGFNITGTGQGVAIADFNGDGTADLAATNFGSGASVSVLLGNNNGTFQAKTDFTTGTAPWFVIAADLNGDGKIDLICNSSNSFVSVLLGNGNGTFQAQTTFATTGALAGGMLLGDVNGDGKADLIVCNTGSASVGVLLGNGNGTFQAKTDFTTGTTPRELALVQTTATITKFAVTAPASGKAFAVTVKAEDASSNVITFYQGVAQFTGGGAGATLPANYTFTTTDAGVHVFSATLTTSGSQTITVTDSVTGSITGTVTVTSAEGLFGQSDMDGLGVGGPFFASPI